MADVPIGTARERYALAQSVGVAPLLLSGSPWAIREDMLRQVVQAARFPELAAAVAARPVPQPSRPAGKVAVIPLTGVITPQGSFLDILFGGSGGLMAFREAFDEAMASDEVSGILLDVDSPGGLVDLVPETAEHVRRARGSKPIVAVADTLMASAAYWIGSQADEIVVTPSGYAGSIGVYRVHVDESGFNEHLGFKVSYVSAGRYKTEGNPDEPLSEDAERDWQRNVDDMYSMFIDAVATARGTSAQAVAAGYGEGRVLNAERAVKAKLADRVDTYEGTLARMLGASQLDSGVAALAAQLADTRAELAQVREALAAAIAPAPELVDPEPDGPSVEERRAFAALLTG